MIQIQIQGDKFQVAQAELAGVAIETEYAGRMLTISQVQSAKDGTIVITIIKEGDAGWIDLKSRDPLGPLFLNDEGTKPKAGKSR